MNCCQYGRCCRTIARLEPLGALEKSARRLVRARSILPITASLLGGPVLRTLLLGGIADLAK